LETPVTEFSERAEPRSTAAGLKRGNAPPPRRKEHIRHAAVTDILLAAESVFARSGFSGATMAEIATVAGLPKANLHYYFRTKAALYRAVLDHILKLWLTETDGIHVEAQPAAALSDYIRAKMRLTATHPDASRVFANEMLHGAPQIGGYLRRELKTLVDEKARVIEHWAAAGLMDRVDARHLFFTIWASTQTYADFEPQVCAVLGRTKLTRAEFERATEQLVQLVLKGCGII
jgi:TetR/AcrR family transcriptional regulator